MILCHFMLPLLLPVFALHAQSPAPPFPERQLEEHAALAGNVPRYNVRDASLKEALDHFWKQALGRPPKFIVARHPGKTPLISMDCKDTPAHELLDYIAGLSGCRWEISGHDSLVLTLQFWPQEGTAGTEDKFASLAFGLNAAGKTAFGLSETDAGPAQTNLRPALQHYGIKFAFDHPDSAEGYAVFMSRQQVAVIVVPESQLALASAVISLGNGGKLNPVSASGSR